MQVLTVPDGKGQKDRTVPMPQVLVPALQAQLDRVLQVHQEDLAAGYAGTFLPSALAEKLHPGERYGVTAAVIDQITGGVNSTTRLHNLAFPWRPWRFGG